MTASWNNIRLMLDEETILSDVFMMIQDYVKPVYVATSAPTKPVYMVGQGEKPAVNVDISLFDGTPVPNFEGRVSSWNGDVNFEWNGKRLGENEHIRADAAGRVALSLAIENKENGWYPQAYNYMFTNADGENQTLYEEGHVNLIWRDLMLVGKPKLGDGTAEVTINTNRIDISKIKTSDDLNNINLLKGAPVTAEVTATLVRHYYNKIEKGTGYDFVNRVAVPIYDYQPAKETVEHYTVTTRGGTATIKDIPCKVTDNDGYTLELRAMDSLGRATDYSVSLTPWSEYWRGEADQRYNLCKQVPLKDRKMVENSSGMVYADDWQTLYRFVDDEEVTFELLCNDKPVSKMKGKVLSAVVQNSVSHVTLTDKATVTLPYSEELLPDYAMVGAYFDGRHVFPISPTDMQFDPEKRELDIKIKGDKATYAPADPVKLSVTVTNKVTGKPAADAEVVVAVVDEAIFAMRGQDTALLYKIYHEVYYPAITQYSSYYASGYGGGAEKGGGGGDQVRKDFQDTAFFATAKTDAQGKTSFSFTMPDNITTWRATGLALTDDNQAGDSKQALVATKKFFVTPVVHETILAGDSFTVGLRSAGTGVSSEAPVSYTVTVKGDGYEKEQTIKSKLREYAPLTFDGLPVGDYTVTVRGSSHGGSDTLQMPFSVIPTGLEVSLHQTFNLAEGIKIDPLRSPVRIEVYNKAYRTYNRVLQNLADNCYGMRADMRIANKYVAQRMEKDGYWYQKSADVDISDLIAILHPLPNSAGDIDLTARLMLALPGMLDLQSVSNLSPENLEGVVGSETSFYLVKALDKKVDATEIKERLAINPDYSFVEKLTMSTALAVLGDTKTAEASYEELVTPRLNKLVGISGEEALYIKDEIDGRTGADCTAAASMLATVLGNKDAEPLMRYLVEKPSQYEPYIAEQLLFLTRFDLKDKTETKLSYTKDGTVKTETVGSRGLRLSLSKKQLAEVNFKVLSGEAYGDVYYTGDILQNNDSVNKKLGITKTITPMEDTLSTGRLVKITLTPDLSGLDRAVGDAQLLVEDYIPSGMCFEEYRPENPFDKANIWWRRGINGQRLSFSCMANQKMNPIVYYVRCNTPGDYVVESAYIASENGKTWGISPRDKVTILSDPAAPKAETTE
ncbi:MAG: alpha-2-macroglobulin family protein [Angelakisella sp.]